MFPITHIWFSEKVLGYSNNMTVLGAIFPDIVIAKCLDYDQTHNCGWELYDYLVNLCSGCEDFAKAMVTHTVNPCGLDYYGDECYGGGYKGYCFQKGRTITADVVKACNIPEEFGLWKAHNFIEMGIEINVVEANRNLSKMLHDALNDGKLLKNVANCLERYYSMQEDVLVGCIKSFTRFIELEETNSQTLACKYKLQMQAKHGIEIDVDAAARIIEDCREMAIEDFDRFISYSTKNVREMIEVKCNE